MKETKIETAEAVLALCQLIQLREAIIKGGCRIGKTLMRKNIQYMFLDLKLQKKQIHLVLYLHCSLRPLNCATISLRTSATSSRNSSRCTA